MDNIKNCDSYKKRCVVLVKAITGPEEAHPAVSVSFSGCI
jgi:hypothetical protein